MNDLESGIRLKGEGEDKGVGGGGRGEIENMVGWCKRSVVLSILDAFKEVAEGSGSGSGWGLD